jgi:methionyl-tRNA synthetase
MPVLKVSENLIKEALEVIRINITVLGDCPQCGGTNYRGGVCEDCAFISPEVMEAIKEWQESQGIQKKAAFKSLAFTDYFTAPPRSKEAKCPRCGRRGFNIQCENPQCMYEEPPTELNHRSPSFTGVNPSLVKNKKHRFIPSAENSVKEKIKKQKSKLKKEKVKRASIGNMLDDDQIASSDKVTRGKDALQAVAQEEFLQNQKGKQSPKETNEEQT